MSYIGTDRSLWPLVTSVYAHEIVQTAFDLYPYNYGFPDPNSYRLWVDKSQALNEYAALVHTRLLQSALAQMLPAGLDLLPDYFATLPPPLDFFARLFRPRNYHDLTLHVVQHLDWYLGLHEMGLYRHPEIHPAEFYLYIREAYADPGE